MSPPETLSPEPPELELSPENRRSYYGLLSDIEASQPILSILIAVCDDRPLRDKLIRACERELQPDIRLYRLQLDRDEPSLRMAIANRVPQEEDLQRGKPGVLMVTGAEDLLFISAKGDRPEVDKFMGYLQWTREGLRAFRYPIVLWVTTQISVNLSEKAPDFWSWRKGVFRFAPETPLDASLTQFDPEMRGGELMQVSPSQEADDDAFLPLEDLQDLIARTETQRGTDDPSLGTLYDRLGQLYARRLRRGEAEDYPKERELAFRCFRKAIELQGKLGLRSDLLNSLMHLGNVYQLQGQFQSVIQYYEQALKLARALNDRSNEAYTLSALGNAFHRLCEYQKSIDCYTHALNIARSHGNFTVQLYALGGMGNSYNCLSMSSQAIDCHQTQLEIARKLGDRQNELYALGGLGNALSSMEKYPEAIEFYEEQLKISRELDDKQNESYALGGLGKAYNQLKQYNRAIKFHHQQLEITRKMNDRQSETYAFSGLHDIYVSLKDYQKAIAFKKQEIQLMKDSQNFKGEAHAWFDLGNTLYKSDKIQDSVSAYKKSREMFESIGFNRKVKQCDRVIQKLVQET